MAVDLCCDIDAGIASTPGACATPTPGIKAAAVSCLANITSFTEDACPAAAVDDIVTEDDLGAPNPSFYTLEINAKASSHVYESTTDQDSGLKTRTETLTLIFKANVKNMATYCALEAMEGKQVIVWWQENGSDRYYLSGRAGDMIVTSVTVSTGSGTDAGNITMVISGNDIQKRFLQIFDTDAATTQTLIDTITV